ncbi:MAG TPA: protein kinase [Stenomitos sp.]
MNSGHLLSQRYKLIKVLGSGGMSETYLAEDTQRPSNPQCVVKKLQPISREPKLLEIARTLFHREAEVLEKLGEHDQIPRLLAHFEENKEFYLVEEYIRGHSLADELHPGRQWPETEVIHFLLEFLPILEFIHDKNVIHRDVKPANIIRREEDGKLVLIDFGAVRQVQADLTASNPAIAATIVGTYGYMPNEQAYGHPKLNSDIYALGIICLQALTGLMPSQLLVDNQTGEFQWPEFVSVSPGLAALLTKMVRYSSKDRYPNAAETMKDVKTLQTKIKTALSGRSELPKLPPVRKPLVLIGLGLASAVGVAWLGSQVLNTFFQPAGAFGGDRILDIGVVSIPRANHKAAYTELETYFKDKLQAQLGDQVGVKLHVIETSEDKALERAKQEIKAQNWELAFTTVPMLSVAAVANQYQFAARMFPHRPQTTSVLFVRKNSPIQSLDDLNAAKSIALGDFNSAQSFYMPIYDLYGKTMQVDLDNTPGKSIEKVRSGLVDVGASVFMPTLKNASDLRILHISRAIPMAGVYIAPKLSTKDRDLVSTLLKQAPQPLQESGRFGAGQPIDYTEFTKVVKRVEDITRCTNWQSNPVAFYCADNSNSIVGTTNGYRTFAQKIEFTMQGSDGKAYRLVLPQNVLDRDPQLDSPTALNFKKVSVKNVQPVETNGVFELRISEPGQLSLAS